MCSERRPHGVGLTENCFFSKKWLGRNSKDGGATSPPPPVASGLTVSTVDDPANSTNTIVQVGSTAASGNKFVYKTSATVLSAPRVGTILTGWTDLPGNGSIAAINGHHVYLAEIKATTNRVVKFGSSVAEVINQPPVVQDSISAQAASVDDGEFTVDASHAFRDDDGDSLELTAVSGDTSVATVRIQGTDMVITPVAAGIANMTLTVDDHKGGTASQTFTVTVTNATPANAAITNPGRNTWFSEYEITFDEPLDTETTAINNVADLIANSRVDIYYPDNNLSFSREITSIRWDLSDHNRPKLYLGTTYGAYSGNYYELEITFVSNQVKDLSGDVTGKATGVIQ